MRAEVCGKKSKVVTESGEGETDATFAARTSGPTLEELEAMYLKPKRQVTRARLPWPLEMRPGRTRSTLRGAGGAVATAQPCGEFCRLDGILRRGESKTPWPLAPGTKMRVPMPQKRPAN